MSDNLPVTPERWREVLDTALEHASHAWAAMSKAGAKEENPDLWPPKSLDAVGTAPYHVAAMIDYVYSVYSGIARVYPEDEMVGHLYAVGVDSYVNLVEFCKSTGQADKIDLDKMAVIMDKSMQAVKELIIKLEEEKKRTSNFEACLDRALKLWQAAHPGADFWPDGAENLAWVFDKLSALELILGSLNFYTGAEAQNMLDVPHNCGHGARAMVRSGHDWRCGVCGQLRIAGARVTDADYSGITAVMGSLTIDPALSMSGGDGGTLASLGEFPSCGHEPRFFLKTPDGLRCSICAQQSGAGEASQDETGN